MVLCPQNAISQKQVSYVQVVNPATPTVTLTTSASTVSYATAVTFTTSVSGSVSTPTGTVTFLDGTTTLGTVTLNSAGVATYTTSSLPAGSDSITASYGGSDNYNPQTSAVLTEGVVGVAPAIAIALSATSITSSQVLTATIAVAGVGSYPSPTGTVSVTCGSFIATSVPLVNGSATVSIPAGTLLAGTDTLTALYTPDTTSALIYNSATNQVSVTVTSSTTAPFTLSSASTVNVVAGSGSNNTDTITITPNAGFSGSITLTAAITSSPKGAVNPPTLSFGSTSPVLITNGKAATATLTITTKAPGKTSTISFNRNEGGRWLVPAGTLPGGAVLACILLICVPRRWRKFRVQVLVLLLLSVLAAGTVGCGVLNNGGTTPGTYAVTVTATYGTTSTTSTFNITVQ